MSNLEKVLYPETGTTKGEVIGYYVAIAPALIPHAANRPVTRKRWPNGVGTEDETIPAFFEKDLGAGAPDWVPRRPVQHSEGPKQYPVIEEAATLAWLAQTAALELHVPQWQFDPGGEWGRVKFKHRDTFEVVAGAVTGTLTDRGELILGRYIDGELHIVGRTTPIHRNQVAGLVAQLRPPEG